MLEPDRELLLPALLGVDEAGKDDDGGGAVVLIGNISEEDEDVVVATGTLLVLPISGGRVSVSISIGVGMIERSHPLSMIKLLRQNAGVAFVS